MNPFNYFFPTTIADASRALGDYGSDARCLAGGTDLLIRMKRHQWLPRAVVNLKNIPGLREISINGEVRIGALATLNDLIRSEIIQANAPALAHAASKMAGYQVRALATVGGNLANASPSADTAPSLIALNARAVIAGARGERVIPLEDFFVGVGKSALAPDEILRAVLIPKKTELDHASFIKLEHREAMDISIASVAVAVSGQPSAISDVRIVLGAVAPTPMRAKQAEDVLRGKQLTADLIAQAAKVAASEAKPIDDVRSSAWYRREMIEVLTRRQLTAMMAAV